MPSIRSYFAAMLFACAGSAAVAQQGDFIVPQNFTFQGRLDFEGKPYTGAASVRLRVYDDAFNGTLLTAIEYPPLSIVNGLLNVDVPYDPAIFNGDPRWLEISMRGQFETVWQILGDRMPLKAAPSAEVASQSRGLVLPYSVSDTLEAAPLISIDNTSTSGFAILGTNLFGGSAGALGFVDAGVLGESETTGVTGIRGQHFGAADDTPGVTGTHEADGFGIGVEGRGGFAGVQGSVDFTQQADGAGVIGAVNGYNTGVYSGVVGIGKTLAGAGISIGVQGSAQSSGNQSFGVGVYGVQGPSPVDWAGYFDGDLFIGGGTFSGQSTSVMGSLESTIAVAPLAAVSLGTGGEVFSAAGSVSSAVWNQAALRYEIQLTGGLDAERDVSISATPVGRFAIPVVSPLSGGMFAVTLHAADGSPIEAGLQLTVHDARPGRVAMPIPRIEPRTVPQPAEGIVTTQPQIPNLPTLPKLPYDGER